MKIILIAFLIYLIYSSIWDLIYLGTPKLENLLTLAISGITFISSIFIGTYTGSIFLFVVPMIVMTCFIFIPIISKHMGTGDGVAYFSELLLLAATSFFTNTNNLYLFIIAWFVSNIVFIVYCVFTKAKGTRRLPMFPFITIGYIVSLIIYFIL